MGNVAIHARAPRKTVQPRARIATSADVERSLVLMPAKKRASANRTTQRTYRSARSRSSFASSVDSPADASSRSASSRAAGEYSSRTKGVSGAPGFSSGSVAIQAATAGLNSSRNRRK
jgi:hypothetical protein